jgi:Deacetylase PdaC
MKIIKILQGHRYLIWTIVFVVVSLVSLILYINYFSDKYIAPVSNQINQHKSGISYVIKKIPDISYVQLTGGASPEILKKVNNDLKYDAFSTSCFGDPSDPESINSMQSNYNDLVSFMEYRDHYATKAEVAKMNNNQIKQRLIDDFDFYYSYSSEVMYAKNNFLSVNVVEEDFCGGAHPNNNRYSFNFNLMTGEDVPFRDLFKNYAKDQKDIEKVVTDALVADRKDDYGSPDYCDYKQDLANKTIEIKNMAYIIVNNGFSAISVGYIRPDQYCEPGGVFIPFSSLIKYLKLDNSFLPKSDLNQTGSYGVKVSYTKGQIIVFPDFGLKYVGQKKTLGPNNASWSITDNVFEIMHGGDTKEISWSSGTGIIGPNPFDFENNKYTIEKAFSEKLGKLAENELVINKLNTTMNSIQRDTSNVLSPDNFTGHWRSGDCQTQEQCGYFDLDLQQEGAVLTGKINAGTGDHTESPKINGTIVGNIATVKFKTTFSGLNGQAIITMSKTGLDWKITKLESGEAYIDDETHLVKVNK